LLRIVAARDGGLCRVKLPGGTLSAAGAYAIAEAARAFGDGAVYLTNRANLQLRGVAASHQQALIDHLLAAGLGPSSPGADDIRNLMLSPMAGLDPLATLDTRPLAAGLLQVLEQQPRYHALSPKFCIQLDGGEALTVLRHPHDLWLSPLWLGGELHLGLGVASGIAQAFPVAAVPARQGAALVLAVLDRFLALAGPQPGRMRDLLAVEPLTALLDGLPLALHAGPLPPLPPRHVPAALGVHPQRQAGRVAVGIAPALGHLSAEGLSALAQMAQGCGSGLLQLTPWQGVLVPDVAQGDAPHVQAQAQALGLLIDPHQSLAATVACTGSAGCGRGLADTKADAYALARLLGRAVPVHLTGCARSCARASVAPVTLQAVSAGHYNLFYRDPSLPGFGRLEGRNLTVQEAAVQLAACPRSLFDD
jgi:precorrin-3B synthase